MWPGHSASAELVHLANSTFWNSFKPRPAQYTFNYITIHMYIYIYIYNDIYIYIHNDTHIYIYIDTYALQIMSIYIQRIQCIYIYLYISTGISYCRKPVHPQFRAENTLHPPPIYSPASVVCDPKRPGLSNLDGTQEHRLRPGGDVRPQTRSYFGQMQFINV